MPCFTTSSIHSPNVQDALLCSHGCYGPAVIHGWLPVAHMLMSQEKWAVRFPGTFPVRLALCSSAQHGA